MASGRLDGLERIHADVRPRPATGTSSSCGPPGYRHVVIMLTAEISEGVHEPITVALPLDDVKRVALAA